MAGVQLNWATREAPEVKMSEKLEAAKLGALRPEEFSKNAVKFGWEHCDPADQTGNGDL